MCIKFDIYLVCLAKVPTYTLYIIHCTYVLFPLSAANMRALKPSLLTILKSMPFTSARRTMMASWLFSIASWRGVFSAASYMKLWTYWVGGNMPIKDFQQYIYIQYKSFIVVRVCGLFTMQRVFSAVVYFLQRNLQKLKLQNILNYICWYVAW